MTTRHRLQLVFLFARKVWHWAVGLYRMARFTWRKRNVASSFELTAIVKGQEFQSYVNAIRGFHAKAMVQLQKREGADS